MRKITVVESVSLDGVLQAPGGPEEDTRDGFPHGGWGRRYADEVQLREMSKGFGTGELLFGRRTYEQFSSYWPHQGDNPFTRVLNETRKYVVSTTLHEPLPWANSVLLAGEHAVKELSHSPGPDLTVLGSGELVRSLHAAGLVEQFVLLIHPIVLGSGRRLFPERGPSGGFRLTSSVPTSTGVIIATYQSEGADR